MIKKYPLKFTAFIFFVIFCTLSFFVYLTLGSGSTSSLIEQMLHREQVIARSGAKSIRSLLLASSNSLFILARNEKIILPSSQTQILLEQTVNNWLETPLSQISLIDTKGKVIAAASNQDKILNLNAVATGRDYFENGLKLPKNGLFVGKPILPRLPGLQNKYLIPVSIPVYNQDRITGIIMATFYVSDLTSAYLDPLKISDQTNIILLDEAGNFLSSVHPEIIGQNIFEYFNNHPFLGDKIIMPMFKEKIKQGGEQKLDIAIPNLSTGKVTRTLTAFSPINLGNNKLMLLVTTPVDDALVFISPYIIRNLLGIIISFFISIFITLFLFNRYIKN